MRPAAALLLAAGLALGTRDAEAQRAPQPTRAFGVGWSPAAGMIGVELVARSFPPAPRLGGALGIGFAGAGVRANLALRDPTANRRVPYVGVGYVALPWIPVLDVTSVTTLEAGVQLWPTGTRHIYADLGAGVGWLGGGAPSTGPVLRLLVGRVF